MTRFKRASGILLHPTSLPGPYGIGDIGPTALRWIDYLRGARQQLWQILPLGPTGYGDSPYQCFSAFAGNPYLISPDLLRTEGLLTEQDLVEATYPEGPVDYGPVIQSKLRLLQTAFENFEKSRARKIKSEFNEFCEKQAVWLDDYALFMALKHEHGGAPWNFWSPDLVHRQPEALAAAGKRLENIIKAQKFWQFIFFRQWDAVHAYAQRNGVQIIGDIPIFVAYDSVDVWQNPNLFYLDPSGNPTVVAGVPPDYFSATGQLWGNPIYRWDVMKADGYQWWLARIKATLTAVDILRIDHFRGFDEYWAIPYGSLTAIHGSWQPGPKTDFFNALRAEMGELPIIAEDLGVVTPSMEALRDHFELPGMKILQLAFDGDPKNPFLPHNYVENCVAYTGTHDNDTTTGWYEKTSTELERHHYRQYFKVSGDDVAWDLIKGVWASPAVLVLAPMQDVLGLDGKARMNFPGRAAGNWSWRMTEGQLNDSQRQQGLAYISAQNQRNTW